MSQEPITQAVKFVEAITEAAGVAGLTPINGAVVDMTDFEGIAFVVCFGTIAAGAVTSIKIQRDTAVAMGAAADLTASAQTVADTDDGKMFITDVYRPAEQFVRGVVNRGTGNATVRAAFYMLYGSRIKPVSGHGSTVVVERLTDPGEGTA